MPCTRAGDQPTSIHQHRFVGFPTPVHPDSDVAFRKPSLFLTRENAQSVGRKMGREVAHKVSAKLENPPFIDDIPSEFLSSLYSGFRIAVFDYRGGEPSQHILPHDSWPWFSYRLEKPRTRLSWHEKNQPIFAANALAKCCGPKRRHFGQKDSGRIDVKILYWVQLQYDFFSGLVVSAHHKEYLVQSCIDRMIIHMISSSSSSSRRSIYAFIY